MPPGVSSHARESNVKKTYEKNQPKKVDDSHARASERGLPLDPQPGHRSLRPCPRTRIKPPPPDRPRSLRYLPSPSAISLQTLIRFMASTAPSRLYSDCRSPPPTPYHFLIVLERRHAGDGDLCR